MEISLENLYVDIGAQRVKGAVLGLSNYANREFKQRRVGATHVKRKWTFCTLEPWF